MLIVVDYGMGNLASVANAFAALGAEVTVTHAPADLERATRIILPGVGAFGEAMGRLRERGLIAPLEDAVLRRRTPVLGICLGMQLLAERSTELGDHPGLGWIRGSVIRLEPSDRSLRIPHIGWNSVARRGTSVLLRGMPLDPSFYFVHSYKFVTSDPGASVGMCDYGDEFAAIVEAGHILGTQFHPEKSQRYGLALLKNFLAVPAPC